MQVLPSMSLQSKKEENANNYFQISLWNRTQNTKTEININSLDLKGKKYKKLINIKL